MVIDEDYFIKYLKNELTEGHDELSNWMKSLQGINIIDHRTP